MIGFDSAAPVLARSFPAALLAAALGCAALGGCGGAAGEPSIDEFSAVAAAGAGSPAASPGAVGRGEPAVPRRPRPPSAQCQRRRRGVTGIQAVVRIERYRGLIHGRNGTHELAFGTIVDTPWVFDASVVDVRRVELSMNVSSATDPTGLPREIQLSPGEIVEVEGEYIPAAQARAREGRTQLAVIHYTHAPCGYVAVGGRMYR